MNYAPLSRKVSESANLLAIYIIYVLGTCLFTQAEMPNYEINC